MNSTQMNYKAKGWRVVAQICVLILIVCSAFALRGTTEGRAAALHAEADSAKKPNIIFVLTDDLAMNLVQYMPNVQAMERDGVTFSNYFVTDSLCCPSRSSIFTGKFPHDTGVFTNQLPDGGYELFNQNGNEAHTFAVALQKSGYRTAMLGKYLNGYLPARDRPAPGWTEWDVAGNGYPEFKYRLNQNGKLVQYGTNPEDYLTDVVARLGEEFIRKSKDHPYFIEIATFAPHAPYIPAPRDAAKFPGLRAPRTKAYGARPNGSAPEWLKAIHPLGPRDIENIDHDFRMRAQAVQAVDKMIGELRAMIAASGQDNTYIVFSSDNGLHMGEHSMRPGKQTPFDTDIQVPLVIVGPGIGKGKVVEEIVENVDLAPTFAELGGASSLIEPDGHSLVPLFSGGQGVDWRDAALIEHHHPIPNASDPDAPVPHAGNPPTYEALRMRSGMYVEYEGGEVGYYELKRDPEELNNVAREMPAEKRKQLHDALAANKACKGTESCWAAQKIPQ